MPFSLHISNDLHSMMEKLTSDMKAHSQKLNPLQPQFIVTQTEGMNIWVRQNLASGNGVVTNVKFLQPMDLVSRLQFYAEMSAAAEPLTRDQWCWMIYGVLGERTFIDRFPLVRSYCDNDDLRRVTLAWRLADLFDQYQIYRSDIIRDQWNKWTAEQLAETDEWQAVLWRRVKELCGTQILDRVEAADRLVAILDDPEVAKRIQRRFSNLYIFGLAVITPFFEKIFARLSSLVHLHLYQINPSPREYWLDDTSERRLARLLGRRNPDLIPRVKGNDLLINWGDVIKDSFKLLFENEELINIADDSRCTPICDIPGDPGSLLKKVQAAIYHNLPVSSLKEQKQIPFSLNDIKDGSIVIKGCFTPAREVEVLYNHLVDVLAASNKGYATRDILVISTDIARYAPYIRSTFDHGPVKIPYSIADVPVGSGDNMFTALAAILDFDGQAFRAEDVMNLLEYAYVRTRFDIQDVGKLRQTVLESGARYGLRRDPEQNEDAHPSSWFSWQHGLKRMIYGLTMILPENQLFDDGEDEVLPLSTAQGSGGMDRIRLAYFLRVLEEHVTNRMEDRGEGRTLGEWADFLKTTMEDLVFSAAEKEDDDYQRFIKILEDLASWDHPEELKIPFKVFRHQFKDRLKVEHRAGQFVSGGITFCSPVPMRSIPHRVVAMLGMDFDAFPRDSQSVNFSLMADYQRGDRNIRKNDNHLFLETLLSAKEKLYISYQARSVKDGTELPPSALVDELIDFVARICDTDVDTLRKEWVEVHPLHPFSTRYDGKTLRNYLHPERFSTKINLEETDKIEFTIPTEVTPADLAKFLVNPPRHFLNKRLKVYYREDETVIPDHELFEIDTIRGGNVKKFLLHQTEPEVQRKWRNIQSRHGKIPVGNLGTAATLNLEEKIFDTRYSYFECMENLEKIDVFKLDFSVGGMKITGDIKGVFRDLNDEFYLIRAVTSSKLKNALETFVDYIFLLASGKSVKLKFISPKGTLSEIDAGTIPSDKAVAILSDWLDDYRKAYEGFIPGYLDLADKVLKKNSKNAEDEDTVTKTLRHVEKNLDDFPFDNKYFQRAWQEGFLTEEEPETVRNCHNRLYGIFYSAMPDSFKNNK